MARTSGILCHPTSLPGDSGVGGLGRHARRFIGHLREMGQSWWQMLPVGPTGFGDSPYQSPSTFAGNPLLIDLEDLIDDGLCDVEAIRWHPRFPTTRVDYGRVLDWRGPIVSEITSTFPDRASFELVEARQRFVDEHGPVWLDGFALFTAVKRSHGGQPWWEWDDELASAEPEAMTRARQALASEIDEIITEQFLFERQFERVRRVASQHGVGLIGDIPIFVAHDSADVWSNRDLFQLDDAGMPTFVAGVPPDYFSRTGQRWGNPLFRWDRHEEDDFRWWTARISRMLQLFDVVRVDHFRGFAASWHIPADAPTAIKGSWIPAPGEKLFDHLQDTLGELPLIAEDLGVITPDVEALRDRYGFPGMNIFQFGFGAEAMHAIDEARKNVVAYTGTHDNQTAIGWWKDPAPERAAERARARELIGTDGSDFHWDLIRAVAESLADASIVPLQDLFGLGDEGRMNIPATTDGNWRWRFTWDQLQPDVTERMRQITTATDRNPRSSDRVRNEPRPPRIASGG